MTMPAAPMADTARALADEARLLALFALRGRELCVCQITAFLDLAPSTVSKHLSVLRGAGLLQSRRDGKWVYYRWAEGDAGTPVGAARAWFEAAAAPALESHAARLEKIAALPLETWCSTRETA